MFKTSISVNHTARVRFSKLYEDFETFFENITLCLECLPECNDRLFRTTSENIKVENVTGFDNDFM